MTVLGYDSTVPVELDELLVVRQLVRDLSLPIEVVGCPIVREADGLAMSSRNVHLHGEDRERALALKAALDAARAAHDEGERDAAAITGRATAAMTTFGVEPEYLALVDPNTLAPLDTVDGEGLLAVAAVVGGTRLIDNTTLGHNLNGRRS
jgi:pantoate--beta-alanine ligase